MPDQTTDRRWVALGDLLRPDLGRWLGLGAIVGFGSAMALAGPLLIREILDRANAGTTTAEVSRLALLFLFTAALAQFSAVAAAWYATVAAWRTTTNLRLTMTRHVLSLDHEFHRTHTPGELIQRVDGDVTSVSDFLAKVFPRALGALFLVVGMAGVLFFISWILAIALIIFFAAALTALLSTRHRSINEAAAEMSALASLYGGIEEHLTAGEDLRSNGASKFAMGRFTSDSQLTLTTTTNRERSFLTMWWVVQGSLVIGMALALVASSVLVSRSAITVGTAFLLFQYLLALSQPLEHVVQQLETVQKAVGALGRVGELMAVKPAITFNGTTSPPAGPLGVTATALSFDYGDDQPVLHDVSLTIGACRSVGIIGRTGSGKTTFTRLVLRLIAATEGTLELGGIPIGEIPHQELRRRVAVIPQEVELFGGSIRDNVTLFDHEPSDDDVREALVNVGLDQLATQDIHRQLGASGAGLSAGESQLLALARVWLRQPDLIVLDEATARVDPHTEQRIDAAVRALTQDRTTLIVAHRLSTLRRVDEIIVFDHGQVVEHGPRAALGDDPTSRYHQLLALALDPAATVEEQIR